MKLTIKIMEYGGAAYNRTVYAAPLKRLGLPFDRSVATLLPTLTPNVVNSRNVMCNMAQILLYNLHF